MMRLGLLMRRELFRARGRKFRRGCIGPLGRRLIPGCGLPLDRALLLRRHLFLGTGLPFGPMHAWIRGILPYRLLFRLAGAVPGKSRWSELALLHLGPRSHPSGRLNASRSEAQRR
jgi:hypothetical protein